jgi:hypothetical protein
MATGRPMSSERTFGRRAREYCGSGTPLALPRCEHMTREAPLDRQYSTVGRLARMRRSSVMRRRQGDVVVHRSRIRFPECPSGQETSCSWVLLACSFAVSVAYRHMPATKAGHPPCCPDNRPCAAPAGEPETGVQGQAGALETRTSRYASVMPVSRKLQDCPQEAAGKSRRANSGRRQVEDFHLPGRPGTSNRRQSVLSLMP